MTVPTNGDIAEESLAGRSYTQLYGTLEAKADDLVKPGTEISPLALVIDSNQRLLERSGSTEQMYEHSRVHVTSTGLLRQRATNSTFDTTKEFNLDQYLSALQEIVNPQRNSSTNGTDVGGTVNGYDPDSITNVSELGVFVYKKMYRVPTIGFLYGPLNVDKKPIKRRERIKLNVGTASAPADVKDTYQGEEDAEQGNLIKFIFDLLVELEEEQEPEDDGSIAPISLLEFILNPFSFSETVENLFFVSFLIKIGKVSLDHNDGIPVIAVVKDNEPTQRDTAAKNNPSAKSGQNATRTQLIIDLDMETWKELCDIYDDVEEPAIPSRGNSDTNKNR
ncbi:Nse4p [Sugiyamaella lignohabitans]|uniref:Non-structural maintenance of chromosomes element 4 n=1 Tax=Sugiyamaella lignohabitans TaxID=796027 RepID=A0A167E3B4_9ASCO|nr:Nse4p [Sugiyamaella lignohabitans]ANB13585.1 Nse4p [Sugiyamaella lignohabitans]